MAHTTREPYLLIQCVQYRESFLEVQYNGKGNTV